MFPPVMGSVRVRRRTGQTPHGDPTFAEHTVDGCTWAPRSEEELTDLRESVITGYWLFAPYGADIQPTDRVIIPKIVDKNGASVEWQVDGEPGRWQSPWSQDEVGLQVALQRAAG